MLLSFAVFLGVATIVDSCVHVGRLLMLLFILLLVVLQQSSTLLALISKRTFELESRLIDGFGCFDVESGSGGALALQLEEFISWYAAHPFFAL